MAEPDACVQPPSFEPAGRSPHLPWARRLTGPLAAGVVLAAFWVFLAASLQDKSLTCDEAIHAAAGYTYWKFNDYRLQPENGNLPQRVIGLPLVLSDYRFPSTDSELWRRWDQWKLGDEWFHRMGNDVEGMLLRGRAANGLLAVALGALVWWWARRLFGPWGGLLSLLLYVLNPTILANGALMTSDTACSLFFLASTWGVWAVLHRLSVSRVLLSALAMGGLFVSKMSAFLIVPVALTLVAARLLDGRPLPVVFGGKEHELARRSRQALAFAAAACAHAVVVVIVIWGFYGFRYTAFAQVQPGCDRPVFSHPWESVLDLPVLNTLLPQLGLSPAQQAAAARTLKDQAAPPDQWTRASLEALQTLRQTVLSSAQARQLDKLMSAPPAALVPRVLDFVRRHQWLPEAYVYGHAYVWKESRQRPSFLNGEFNLEGRKSFFPYTFLVKTPLPVFGVILLAIAAGAARWRAAPAGSRARAFYETLPLWVLPAFLWVAAVMSHLNIGHRHLMPTYPPLFVLCGAAVHWWGGRRRTGAGGSPAVRAAGVVLGGLLAALAAEVLYRFPNYLAYFNGIVSPARAYRHLVDSSLDWGQDLPGVRRYLEEHPPAGPVYLSYFGSGSPKYYRIPATCIDCWPGWDLQDSPPLRLLEPSGGRTTVPPDYEVMGVTHDGKNPREMLLKKPSKLRLTGGTYFISATMLQPVLLYNQQSEPQEELESQWSERYEAIYQNLCRTVKPLLGDDPAARLAAFNRRPFAEWANQLRLFDEFRFTRLTAYLRQREPDDNVNFSILIYRLTDADIARALDGPAPELGSAAAAKRHYEEMVRRQPGEAGPHCQLGQVLAGMGRTAEAAEQYGQALRLKPDYADAHYNLANVLVQMGRPAEAIGHYEQALRLKPDHAGAHNNLGSVLLQMGRVTEAAEHYEQALRIKPDYADAHHNLATALFQMGRMEEAGEHLREVVRLQPDSAEAHGNLGNFLARMGRTAEAIEHYEEALRIRPDYPKVRHNLDRLQALQPALHPGN